MMALLSTQSYAGNLGIEVLGPDGQPVPDVAIYVTYATPGAAGKPRSAVMDQVDTKFVPHILVVQKGTAVDFPNSDTIAHHVYSFSKPNNFVLPLYKGDKHDPVKFDYDGIVTLGCNIHDHMLAYIVVVDTPTFGVTDEAGRADVTVNDTWGQATVHIWSPRIRDEVLSRAVVSGSSTVTYALEKRLRPTHDSGSEAVQWSEY